MARAGSTTKPRNKVPSAAEKKRLKQQEFEAQKTEVERRAETIAKKNPISALHPSVVRATSNVEKRKKPTKSIKLISKEAALRQLDQQLEKARDETAKREAEIDYQHYGILKKAEGLRRKTEALEAKEKTKFHQLLRDCYSLFQQIEQRIAQPESLYETLRQYFKARLIPAQSNTPNAALLVRFVFEAKSRKQVSEYATVLQYAKEMKVSINQFITWYTTTTQTKILRAARADPEAIEQQLDQREQLRRATTLLLRYLDYREDQPLGYFQYPEKSLQRNIHLPDDFVFVIGRVMRTFNRDTYFDPDNPKATVVPQANVCALHFIPSNIEVTADLINRMARFLVKDIDQLEAQMDSLAEKDWIDSLARRLSEEELEAALIANRRLASQLQASLSAGPQKKAAKARQRAERKNQK